jgi:peptide chain release factor 1
LNEIAKYDRVLARYATLESSLQGALSREDYVALSREYAELRPLVEEIRRLEQARRELADLAQLKDGADPDMASLAEEEFYEMRDKVAELERAVRILLLPKDAADDKNVILEIRAGAGGDEAALFAGELFNMYQRYAVLEGWKVEIISESEATVGGYKEVVAAISGGGVFSKLKFESGVHRVQRVPVTESSGRIHTSTVTVAVLAEPEEFDIEIEEKDLRIDVFRSSGPGGQSVNTTDSAVRITHLPTGLVVSQQDEKSQHKNRAKAMKILRARLYDAEQQRRAEERAAERRGQVGSGDRSERIRTYNFPQGRVTDHRINLTLYKLDRVMTGEALGEVVEALITEDRTARLSAIEAEA